MQYDRETRCRLDDETREYRVKTLIQPRAVAPRSLSRASGSPLFPASQYRRWEENDPPLIRSSTYRAICDIHISWEFGLHREKSW